MAARADDAAARDGRPAAARRRRASRTRTAAWRRSSARWPTRARSRATQLAERLAARPAHGMPQIAASSRRCARLIVRGPMRGRQHAYVLVRDWLGEQPPVDRDAALARARAPLPRGPRARRPTATSRSGRASRCATRGPGARRRAGERAARGRRAARSCRRRSSSARFEPVLLGLGDRATTSSARTATRITVGRPVPLVRAGRRPRRRDVGAARRRDRRSSRSSASPPSDRAALARTPRPSGASSRAEPLASAPMRDTLAAVLAPARRPRRPPPRTPAEPERDSPLMRLFGQQRPRRRSSAARRRARRAVTAPPRDAARRRAARGRTPSPACRAATPADAPGREDGFRCNTELVGHVASARRLQGPALRRQGRPRVRLLRHDAALPAQRRQPVRRRPTGVAVLDMSDPANPVRTDTLVTPGDADAARVARAQPEARAARRGHRQPDRLPGHRRHLRRQRGLPPPGPAVERGRPGGFGHESGFAPDGNTFYSTSIGTGDVTAIDVTDPKAPKVVWRRQLPLPRPDGQRRRQPPLPRGGRRRVRGRGPDHPRLERDPGAQARPAGPRGRPRQLAERDDPAGRDPGDDRRPARTRSRSTSSRRARTARRRRTARASAPRASSTSRDETKPKVISEHPPRGPPAREPRRRSPTTPAP